MTPPPPPRTTNTKKKCVKRKKSVGRTKGSTTPIKKSKKTKSVTTTAAGPNSVKYTEDQLQYDLGNYIKEKHPYAIVNGCLAGSCGRKLFRDMVRKHYRYGWPDMCIANARGGYHGLYIELKSKNGKLRDNQVIVLKELHDEGYKIAVINDYLKGCQLVDDYFSMSKMKMTKKEDKQSSSRKKNSVTIDAMLKEKKRHSCGGGEMIIIEID